MEFSHHNPMVRQARGAPAQAGGGGDGWIRARINTNPASIDRHTEEMHGYPDNQAAMGKATATAKEGAGARAQLVELTIQTRTEPSRPRV